MKKVGLLLPVYLALLIVMFLLPRFNFEGYSILRNTTSHLGAQAGLLQQVSEVVEKIHKDGYLMCPGQYILKCTKT